MLELDVPFASLTPEVEPPARRRFHQALAFAFVPVLLVLTPFLALLQAPEVGAETKWAKALRGLALLDLLIVVLCLAAFQARVPAQPAAPVGVSRAGLQLDSAPGGLRVLRVASGSPAQKAGVVAGDVLASLHGHPLGTPADFDRWLGEEGPKLRTLGLFRDRKFIILRIDSLESFTPALFKPLGVRASDTLGGNLRSYAAGMLALLAVALWAGRRGSRAGVLATSGVIAAAALASAGAMLLLRELSLGTIMVGQLAFSAALLAGGLLFRAPAGEEQEEPPAIVRRGIYYAFCFSVRLTFIGRALLVLVPIFDAPYSPLDLMRVLPASGVALSLLAVVVLAPLGEELVFRGMLQPALRKVASAPVAIAVSAAVFALFHPHYGPLALQTFGLGCVLGWARERTGSVGSSIAIQAVVNAFASVVGLALRAF